MESPMSHLIRCSGVTSGAVRFVVMGPAAAILRLTLPRHRENVHFKQKILRFLHGTESRSYGTQNFDSKLCCMTSSKRHTADDEHRSGSVEQICTSDHMVWNC